MCPFEYGDGLWYECAGARGRLLDALPNAADPEDVEDSLVYGNLSRAFAELIDVVWLDMVKLVRDTRPVFNVDAAPYSLRMGREGEGEPCCLWEALPQDNREILWSFVIGLEGEERHRATIERELVACSKKLFVLERYELAEQLCVRLGYVAAEDVDKLAKGVQLVEHDPLELFKASASLPDGVSRYGAMFETAQTNAFDWVLRLFFSNPLYNADLDGARQSGRCQPMLDVLRDVAQSCGDAADAALLISLRTIVGKLYCIHTPRRYPEGLRTSDAWLALRHAWAEPSYYFSIAELQFVMALLGTCVEIYSFVASPVGLGQFRLEESLTLPRVEEASEESIVRVVYDGDAQSGRGHYSRLLSAEAWIDIDATHEAAVREGAEAEAKRQAGAERRRNELERKRRAEELKEAQLREHAKKARVAEQEEDSVVKQCLDVVAQVTDAIESIGRRRRCKDPLRVEVGDLPILISHARNAVRKRSISGSSVQSLCESFPFIPRDLLVRLRSFYADEAGLRRVLSQSWVAGWPKWVGLRDDWEEAEGDEDLEGLLADYCAVYVSQRTLHDVIVDAKSDATRRQELRELDRNIGQGYGFGRLNASLPDSILQLLSWHGVLPSELQGGAEQRRAACEQVRTYIKDTDELIPFLRDDVGQIVDGATDDEHADAPLDYLIHGEAVVRFFLQHFAVPLPSTCGGCKIIAYTRFDSADFSPVHSSCVFGQCDDQSNESPERGLLLLELYANTGKGIYSRDYDPVLPPGCNVLVLDGYHASTDAASGSGGGDGPDVTKVDSDIPPPPAPHPSARRPRRPLQSEQSAPAASVSDGVEFFNLQCLEHSPDPRRKLEAALEMAAEQLRPSPTVPCELLNPAQPWADALREDMAVQLPRKHCAFAGCTWATDPLEDRTSAMAAERALVDHLMEHDEELDYVASLLPSFDGVAVVPAQPKKRRNTSHAGCRNVVEEDRRARFAAAYNEAIAVAVRRGAPLATYSISRRCLYNYTTSLDDDHVYSLACFCCARRYPYVRDRRRNEIKWVDGALKVEHTASIQSWRFLGMTQATTESLFGLETYLKKYGKCEEDGPNLREHPEDFEDWYMDVQFPEGSTRVFCCPEDRKCVDPQCNRGEHGRVCCAQCSLPVCNQCESGRVDQHGKFRLPPAALANDMAVFYAPRELYAKQVTILEMICASPCLTSMSIHIPYDLETPHAKHTDFMPLVYLGALKI